MQCNLFDYDQKALCEFVVQNGEPSFRGRQLLKWIHQCHITDFNLMSNLPKNLRVKLSTLAYLEVPNIIQEQISQDGTHKWLMQLNDNNRIETVFIPEAKRGTLCISSQVGCSLNCRFCATARQGFNRNLSVAEIIGQLWRAKQQLYDSQYKITNVVMMGMGEPLLNFDNVLRAMNIMLDDHAYGLSKYRVTLSTSGLVPQLQKLSQLSPVSLAVSLHAPNDKLRNSLVPINKKYPLKDLLSTCRHYFAHDRRRHITIEYVLLHGVNDQTCHAKELIQILKGISCKINLIPFNPFANSGFQCSSSAAIDNFYQILIQAKLNTTIRRTRGNDINAACGQLVGDFQDRTKRRQLQFKKI